ncbi:MAG TPA: FAD:protein FMN transferase [Solirubrobacterales bacterium]|nr:FAD:protein FMN transferase [Solirubrobacterales bacterium]
MSAEARQDFDCFGGRVAVSMRGEEGEARLALARETLRDAHRRLSRFEPDSELSRMNGDPRRVIPASPLLRRLVIAAYTAGELSGGLVDATLLDEIERLGYIDSVAPGQGPPPGNGAGRAPASPSPKEGWRALAVDEEAGCVVRPPGVRLDSGGIAKGLLADIVGEQLADARVFAVDCCGDIRFGGRAGLVRRVKVESPFGGAPLHELTLREGAVATSGITRRTWLGPGGRAAHQIIDPGTGAPAATGAVQVTALAPSALHAEVFAKAALLAGPEGAEPWLPFGGVLVLEDGGIEVFEGADLPGTQ